METWHEYTLDSFVYVDPKNQPRKKKTKNKTVALIVGHNTYIV
jgi:hypothetical protein